MENINERTRYAESPLVRPLIDELTAQSISPPNGDKGIAAFSSAAISEIGRGELGPVVEDFLQHREGIVPSYAANLLLRAMQKQALSDKRGDYPLRADQTDYWRHEINRVIKDPVSSEELMFDLYTQGVTSNVAERYKAFKLLLSILSERFSTNPTILDIGCSQNQGLKKLALNRRLPWPKYKFGKVEVNLSSMDQVDGASVEFDSFAYAAMFNRRLRKKLKIGKSIGIDITNADDPMIKEWARSCSFYPSELLNKRRRREYDGLDHKKPKKVKFFRGDFADFQEQDFERFSTQQQFDMVTFSTVLYQVEPEEREKMLQLARKFTKPGGLIVIQDFVGLKTLEDEKEPERLSDQLEFYSNWFRKPYSYRTLVMDTSDESGRFHEIFRWENGRCNRLQFNLGLLSVGGALHPNKDAAVYVSEETRTAFNNIFYPKDT